ncbi:MAG: cyclic nucleotide-binding domain-containing protein [Myxococcota bacterium]
MSNADKLRKHKDEAARQLAKGRVKEALEELLNVQKLDPGDLATRQRIGDLWAKVGNKEKAIEAYQGVAGAFAADGLLLKAIAVSKLILQLDPNHTETQRTLAELYGKKRGDFNTAELPAAMSTVIAQRPAPGQKLSASMIRGIPAQQLPLRQGTGAGAAPARMPTGTGAAPAAAPAPAPVAPPPPRPAPAPVAAKPDDGAIELDFQPPPARPAAAPAPARASGAAEIELDVEEVPVVAGALVGTPEPPPAVVGQPLAPPTGPASSWGAPVAEPEPVVVVPALGPPSLEEMEMPAIDANAAEIEVDATGGAETDFGELLVDETAAPAKVDLDKLPPIPLFSELSKNAFIDLMERMEIRTMMTGDVIIQEGARGDSFFIIASGSVKVEKVINGTPTQLATLSDGAFFGEMALLSEAPRAASVVASSDGELFEISRATLDAVIRDYPSVAQVMLRFYKQRLLSNLLNMSPIFAPFDKNQRKNLIEQFKSREVAPGEMILTEGQKGDGLYLVLSGRCSVKKNGGSGAIELAQLKEGDVFGEMSLLTRAPVSASIEAINKCIVLRLPRKQFNEIIMTHPQVLELVSELSAQRQKSNQRLVQTGSGAGGVLV